MNAGGRPWTLLRRRALRALGALGALGVPAFLAEVDFAVVRVGRRSGGTLP